MNVQYLIIVPVILLACGKVLLQGMISRNYLKNMTDVALYNAIVFGGMSVIYLVFNGLRLPQPGIIFYGVIYGLLNTFFQIFYTMAMQRGPVALTTLITTFSTVFTVSFGMLYCNETLNPLNMFGLVCMFLSLLLTIDFKQAKEHRFSIVWFLLCLCSMIFNGLASIFIKIQKMNIPDQDISMLLVTYTTGAASLLLFCLFQSKVLHKPKTVVLHPSRVTVMLSVSLILGVYFVFYLYGIGIVPSVIFFPLTNIGPTTVISILSVFIFKDRLTTQQIFSLVFGIAATLLLCL